MPERIGRYEFRTAMAGRRIEIGRTPVAFVPIDDADAVNTWTHIGPVRAEVVGDQGDEGGTERKSADVYIFDAIGGWSGTTATSFVRDVAALDVDHIDLHLNSPGGNAMDGVAIANVLRQHRADVTVWVDGIAASAASVIAMAGDEVVMGIGSQLMIHDASGYAFGPASEMRKAAQMLDSTSNAYASAYAAKAGGTAAEWRELMVEEVWYTGEEAVAAKLADRIATDEDNGRSSGEQVVPGSSTPSFWDMWDELASAERHADVVKALYAHAGREDAPPPPMPKAQLGHLEIAVPGAYNLGSGAARRRLLTEIRDGLTRIDRETGSQTPAATASGSTHQERSAPVPFTDEHLATMRTKLGLAADADEDQIVATVTEVMDKFVEDDTPPGTVLVSASVLDDLKAKAEQGVAARQQQEKERRERLVEAALRDGRIRPADRDSWLADLEKDPERREATLASLTPGLVPLTEIGTAAADASGDVDADALYEQVFGTDEKEASRG